VPLVVLVDGRHSQPPEHVTRVHPPPRMKVTWPLPCGPPEGLYTGRMLDPTGALPRVDTDANEGPIITLLMFTAGTRAKNLEQLVQVLLEVADELQHEEV
jgi:hypothetical protein